MKDYSPSVTCLSVTKNDQTIASIEDIIPSETERHEFMKYSLAKGKYDIDYVITVLRVILHKCEELKFSPRDLQFTLSDSVKRLLAMLEVEKSQLK